MSSVSPISNLASGQTAFWETKLADQITQNLQVLSAALQSGDTAAASTALNALQSLLKTSDPASALASKATLLEDLTWMSQALDSHDSTMIASAFATLQKDLSALVVSVLSGTRQLQSTHMLRNQELSSGDSITISSASTASQKSDAVVPTPSSSANSAASLAYLANIPNTLSADLGNSRIAVKPELDPLSAQLAQEAAKIAAPVNEYVINHPEGHGSTYLALVLAVALTALLLFWFL